MKITTRLVSLLLCIVMVSAVACLSVSAITLLPVGYWVYHEINDNTEVEIYDYTGEQANLYTAYTNNRIPITTVGENAFSGNETLQKITLSKNMTTVLNHAFFNCSNLQTVVFESTKISKIDMYAFAGCTSLSSINLEDTFITTISFGTFMNCTSLSEVRLPETVTAIEAKAFANCSSLKKIVIPASVESISGDAFVGRSDELTIYCYTDSLAHRYAENNSIDYVLIDQIPVETYLLGDVNNDGDVSITDASHIQLFLVGKKECDDKGVIRGDVDLDGELTVVDASLIQRFLAAYKDEKGKYINEVFEFPVSY